MADLNRRQTTVNVIREVRTFVQNQLANSPYDRVNLYLNILRRNFENFLEIHDRLIGAAIPQPEYDEHERLRNEIQALVIDLETQILVQIGVLDQQAQAQAPPAPAPVQQPQQAQDPQEMRYLLTQKIENTWGEFDGTLSKWATFKDMFTSAVHELGYVTNVYKFQLLMRSLKGEAYEVLEGWQITGDNYPLAWARLNSVFNQPHQTATQQIKKLNDLEKIEKANRKQLQHLSNVANSVKMQATGMGYNTEHWDIMFLSILEEKIDRYTKREWEKERENENPTLAQFLTFIDKQARIAPDTWTDPNKSNRASDKPKRQHERHANSFHPYKKPNAEKPGFRKVEVKRENRRDSVNTNVKCPMTACGLSHFLFRCPKYLALNRDERENFLKGNKLCLNCLRPGHFVRFCSKDGCNRCEKKHNSTICPGNPFLSKVNAVKTEKVKVEKETQ